MSSALTMSRKADSSAGKRERTSKAATAEAAEVKGQRGEIAGCNILGTPEVEGEKTRRRESQGGGAPAFSSWIFSRSTRSVPAE